MADKPSANKRKLTTQRAMLDGLRENGKKKARKKKRAKR